MNSKHISSNGQFASKRAGKSQMWFFKLLFIIILAIVGGGYYLGYQDSIVKRLSTKPNVIVNKIVKEVKAERSPDRLDKAIEKMKEEVVAKLKDGESRGIEFVSGEMKPTFDPPQSLKSVCSRVGGTMKSECLSYGHYQMKLGTIKMWQKELGDPVMSDMEAIELAFDDKKSSEFVERVIFQIKGSVWNWSYATANRTWFDDKISTIRTLSEIK